MNACVRCQCFPCQCSRIREFTVRPYSFTPRAPSDVQRRPVVKIGAGVPDRPGRRKGR